MIIVVNGTQQDVPEATRIEKLIADLNLRPDAVAIVVNDQIIGREQVGQTQLSDGDRVEIVQMVGGG